MRKLNWILWWLSSVFWFLAFIGLSIYIFTRAIDGAGVVQTPGSRFLSFVVLLFAFTFPLALQVVWFIVNVMTDRD